MDTSMEVIMNRDLFKSSESRSILLILVTTEMLIIAMFFSGCWQTLETCTDDSWTCSEEATLPSEGDGGNGGVDPDDLFVMDLPLHDGYISRCTQGPSGSYSHDYSSTRYGVDLDTNNYVGEGVYAPVSGDLHIHGSPNTESGFGYHVNINLGDGRYVVIGHLSSVAVRNGDDVVAGQFIGIEGCSGNCTGDHIHLGLSEGSSAMSADMGISLPFALRTRDVSESEDAEVIPATDLSCGLSDGHRYESLLQTANWHPDGMLLSVPGESDIYVVDQGRLHPWLDEAIMLSFGFEYESILPISPHERDCFEMGSTITEYACYRAVSEGATVWLAYECEETSGRYRLPIPEEAIWPILKSWNIEDVTSADSTLGAQLLAYPIGAGTARLRDGTLVREMSDSDVFAVNEGVAVPIFNGDVYLSLGLGRQEVIVVQDGVLVRAVLGVASCASLSGCIDFDRIRQCGGALDVSDIADGGEGGGPDDLPDPSDDDDATEDPACQTDTDGDGVFDCNDNCPLADNDQGDIDQDGTGDSCDPDIDGDGVSNALDCAPFNASIGLCPESACDDAADNDQDGDFDCNDTDCATEYPCQSNQGDDDDDASDDDDATPEPIEGDDDDASPEPPVGGDDDDATVPVISTLELTYTPPSVLAPYTYIELSGEYTLADGSPGFPWVTGLDTEVNASSLIFILPGVSSGDSFRFSLEYYDAPTSVLSWQCIGPAPYTAQGTLTAFVDGSPIPVNLINNFLGGCEDLVLIP